jgi:predicted ABC-type ATPase
MAKVIFITKHPSLSIMREPVEVTRSVNGVMQIMKEDRVPFKFKNGQLILTDKDEIKEVRKARNNGVLFEEVHSDVVNEAEKTTVEDIKKEVATGNKFIPEEAIDDMISEDGATHTEPNIEAIETELEVVVEVTSFNQAQTYLRKHYDLEFKDVNTKAEIKAQIERLGIDFPNYDL